MRRGRISKPASRIGALLLAVFMLFGMLPVSAFADGETTTYNLVTEVDGIESGKDYVIVVGDKYALTNEEGPQVGSTQGGNAYKGLKSGEVQISNTQIVSGVTSNMIWTVSVADGKLTITDAEGKFLTANYGGTGHGNTRKLLVDTTVDGNWEYSTKSNKNVLNNTSQNTTQTGDDNGCYLYLLDDNEYHSIGVKSQGSNYKNAAKVDFYEVVEAPSVHTHDWSYEAEGATITATCGGTGTCDATNKSIALVAPTNLTYDGNAKAATITGAIDGVTNPTITYTPAECKNAGNYTASITLGEATATVSFTIAKADQAAFAITGAATATYGDAPVALTTTGGSGDGAVAWEITVGSDYATINNGAVTITGAGSVTVKATKAGGDNYNAATATHTIAIAKKNTAAPSAVTGNATFANGTYTYTITAIDGAEYSKDGTTWQDSNVFSGLTVGKYTFYARIKETANTKASEAKASAEVDLSKQAGTATVTIQGWTYGDAAKAPVPVSETNGNTGVTYLYTSTDDKGYSSATAPTNAGAYKVTATFSANDTYSAVTAEATFTIAKKAVTVTAKAATKVYNAELPELEYAVTGLVGSETLSGALATTATKTSDVGEYDITQGTLAASNNYTVTFTPAKLTITKATPVVTAPVAKTGLTAGTTAQELVTAGSTTGGTLQYKVNDGAYGTAIPTGTAAGEYTVYYKVVGGTNYNDVAEKSFTVTIAPAPAAESTVTYTKIDADEIKEGDKIVIVGKTSSKTVALSKNGQEVNVTVTGNTVAVNNASDVANVVWTVGKSNTQQANGQSKSFTFNISGSYLARKSGNGHTNDFEIKTSGLDNKYIGHYVEDGTFGNDSGSVTPPFYGLAYTSNGFKYVNSNDSAYETAVGNIFYYKEVTVNDDGEDDTVAVTGVTLNEDALNLTVNGTATLEATVAPEGATNKAVTWSSSDATIASVSNAGVVTAVKAGTATITVTTADGSKTASCTVTVSAASVAVTGVTLNKTSTALTVGATETLTATVAPEGATNKNVTWTSSDATVASVSNAGVVTAVKAGTATITVTTADGSKTATCTVNVTAAQTPDEDDEPTYTKINASDIKAGDKIVIVGVSGNSYYALTNGSTQTTAVTVSNNELTITGSPNALVWTVGEATGNQVDTANAKFTISNDGDYLARVSGSGYTNDITFKASDLNTKYVGHAVLNGTIGNNSGSVEPPFYGLAYTNDGFKYVNENESGYVSNSTTPNVLFFRAYNVADGEGGGNQGGDQGGNEGGSATNPTGTTFLAFSSDAHTKTKNVNEGSPARLNNWLNNVSAKTGQFDIMALCGDFTYDGGSGITGTDYWDHAEAVMSVVEDSAKVDDHVYINGNHEWQHGSYDSYKSSHDAAKKITGIGQVITGDDYIIYTFGAASSSQAYNTSDITALGNWLKSAPTNKPIFIISHYPIHSISGRSTTNADTLRTTLNEYADDHDIYFIWGHNHTNAGSGENHYDQVYTGTLDNQTIGFTYLAAGCMSDSENNTGSASVKGKGLVAKIVDGEVESLTYYGESGNVVLEYKVDNTTDPDQPGTDDPEDPEDPEDPIVPDEPGKVTTLEDGYYIIVSNNNTKALTNVVNSGYTNTNNYSYSGFNGADVTISGDKITAGATETMVFEIKAVSGGYTIRNVEKDQYLTATYTQNSSGSGYTGKLFLSDTAETWELDSNFRLKSTNASATGRDGLGLYLTFDDKTDSISSGAANFFGIRSEGDDHDFANVDKIDFYKVEVEEEPEPEQPDEPEHEHAWGDVTYTFAANGASCTATRACSGCETTETATATITSAVKTAATCETKGTTTYTATFTEEWAETQNKDVQDIPVVEHVYEDGSCTSCGAEDPAEAGLFELYGANMALGNNLSMNFYIETADLEFGEDYYAVITKDYADGREDYTLEIQDEDWQEYNSSLYRITMNKIAAKEMADKITVVIYNDEDEQVSKTWVDSVRAYTMRGIEGQMEEEEPNEELMAVYVEMLNYGAAAQETFDYNVEDLANNELTDAHLEYGLSKVQVNDFRVSEGAFYGSSLTLESNILLNFYFTINPADYEGLEAVATYTDHYGDDHEVIFDEDDFNKYNSTTWSLTLDTLVVADCRESVTVVVCDADGEKLASVTDSIESYAARMGENDPMSIAIMTFAVAAYNNFHK